MSEYSPKNKTVAILTTFNEFNPGYSLTGIVVDQAHMLARHGHKVLIFVTEQFNPKHNLDSGLEKVQEKYPDKIFILKKTKFMHLKDYSKDTLSDEHKKQADEAGEVFAKEFIDHSVDVAFTHDFVFTGWNLPYYHALIKANNLLKEKQSNCLWYHWIHSVPVAQHRKPWWTLQPFGLNHFLVFPNRTEIMRVAESYQVPPQRVKIIPHIKDIRTWYDFGEDAMKLIDLYPSIMEAQIIQVYPCSTDRLSAKQLDIGIKLFSHFKMTAKLPVFLVIANQWATGRQPKENVKRYTAMAEELGLVKGKDFAFTSEAGDEWRTGISKRMLRELQLLSNVFIFPTKEESFGLVGPESSFSGALTVMNRSLNMLSEVMSTAPPSFEFSSFHNNTEDIKNDNYIRAVAMAILNRMQGNEAIITKVWCRCQYNMDNLYHRAYIHNLG